jgi:ribonuclease Y
MTSTDMDVFSQLSPLAFFALGLVIGALAIWIFRRITLGSHHKLAAEILQRAETDAETFKATAQISLRKQELEQQHELERIAYASKKKLQKEEERLQQKEDKLEIRMNLVEKKLSDIDKKEAVVNARRERNEEERKNLAETQNKLVGELERASGLTATEARELLLERIRGQAATDAANVTRRIQAEAHEHAEQEAARIIATAINRMAVSSVSEATVTTVAIPSDEMKGRIIGKEGRNIRALEQATGINFIIDDTPNAVVLSGFDPIRKHIARMALSELVLDGRIHPTRIEEAVERARENVSKQIKQSGEDAALRAKVIHLHPELITLLGKLKFRYSYGQNVLDHSLEVSNLMGLIAAELGLDETLARRIGLLHDIGKAVTHEIEGSHAIIGHDFALKYGETDKVANGIGCHHQEMPPITVEGSFCSAADAISASRPGARIEAVEQYIKRLQKLESLAYEFPGIEKAYAMQAGREIRVVVLADQVDDDQLVNMSRDLAGKIEHNLTYPGKIKVTLIREKRVIEYAL